MPDTGELLRIQKQEDHLNWAWPRVTRRTQQLHPTLICAAFNTCFGSKAIDFQFHPNWTQLISQFPHVISGFGDDQLPQNDCFEFQQEYLCVCRFFFAHFQHKQRVWFRRQKILWHKAHQQTVFQSLFVSDVTSAKWRAVCMFFWHVTSSRREFATRTRATFKVKILELKMSTVQTLHKSWM